LIQQARSREGRRPETEVHVLSGIVILTSVFVFYALAAPKLERLSITAPTIFTHLRRSASGDDRRPLAAHP
jgi:hypothetical protein